MQKSGKRYLIIKRIFGISPRDKYKYIIEDLRRYRNEVEAECLPGGADYTPFSPLLRAFRVFFYRP
jgi:hypothetical protein